MSLQLNVEDFAPASNDEKKSLVVMRESVNFWKDGMRRLRKNKIAMVSLVVILLIAFMAYVLPSFWPYSYEQQIKGSNNLAPFEYSAAEQKLIDQGENVLLVLAHAAGGEILLQMLYFNEILAHQALPPFSNSSFWRSQQ